jgi:capsule biosynthesis phosphatase
MDLDNTITTGGGSDYRTVEPNYAVIERMHDYRSLGFEIVISTARNMRTYDGNIGKITANTVPVILEWLARHNVPFDELLIGKPWCGHDGFYVDDRAIRPAEFATMTYDDVRTLLDAKKME